MTYAIQEMTWKWQKTHAQDLKMKRKLVSVSARENGVNDSPDLYGFTFGDFSYM